MTDEYAKTVVIRDPDYRPGDAFAPSPGPVTKEKPARPEMSDSPPADYPDFNDTSWLT